MKFIILIILLQSVLAEQISFTCDEKSPVELKAILTHIEAQKELSKDDTTSISNSVKKINEAYNYLSSKNFLFTFETTLYSALLDYKNPDFQQISIKVSDFAIIENKLKANPSFYTYFTTWFFEQIRDDFSEFFEKNYLDNFEGAPLTEKNAKRKKKLVRLIKIYSPIIRIYKTYDQAKLARFLTKLSVFSLEQIANKFPFYKALDLKKINNEKLISYNIKKSPNNKSSNQDILGGQELSKQAQKAINDIKSDNKKEAIDSLMKDFE